VQSRLDLHRHQLLQKKLARVRDLDLADVLSRVAPSAVVLELKQVRLAEQTAPIANMHTVAIRHIKQSFFEETSSSVRDHAISLHLSKTKSSITSSTLSWLAGKNLGGTSTS